MHCTATPLWTDCNQILHVWSGERCDRWCQVLRKSVKGFRSYRTPPKRHFLYLTFIALTTVSALPCCTVSGSNFLILSVWKQHAMETWHCQQQSPMVDHNNNVPKAAVTKIPLGYSSTTIVSQSQTLLGKRVIESPQRCQLYCRGAVNCKQWQHNIISMSVWWQLNHHHHHNHL